MHRIVIVLESVAWALYKTTGLALSWLVERTFVRLIAGHLSAY